MELNENFLNSMPNSWNKQAYVKVFDCKYVTFKKYLNMFERMEVMESIYEGVVEPSYKKGKIEENPPHHIFIMRRVRALASEKTDM